tara:strand:- start:7 stop:699 length:693 start_codon:yes stop_codon:yes gene_type:complete
MEPISKEHPKKGFLNYVRKVATKNNIILIFDEVVTGFRWDLGGYQKKIKVIPDLSCFSKAMGNGFPISAMVGKKEIMSKCNEVFYSLTFGSDPVAMAASISTIDFLKKNKVLPKINNMGNYFIKNFEKLIKQFKLDNYINITGFAVKNIINIKGDDEISAELIRSHLLGLLAKNQVLSLGYNIFSYSHNKKIMDKLLVSYEKSLDQLQKQMLHDSLKSTKSFKMSSVIDL